MTDRDPVQRVYQQIREAVGADEVGQPATTAPVFVAALWRERAGRREVYLVQQPARAPLLGGCWTLPGTWVTPDGPFQPADVRVARIQVDADVDTGGAWVEPGDAIRRFEAARWLIPPAIARALRELAGEPLVVDPSPRWWPLAPAIAVLALRTPTLPPAAHTNCYVIGDRELVVIDPASPHDGEQAALERALDHRIAAGARVRAIWLTHHHRDHVGAAARMSARYAAPIAAHRETAAPRGLGPQASGFRFRTMTGCSGKPAPPVLGPEV